MNYSRSINHAEASRHSTEGKNWKLDTAKSPHEAPPLSHRTRGDYTFLGRAPPILSMALVEVTLFFTVSIRLSASPLGLGRETQCAHTRVPLPKENARHVPMPGRPGYS